MSFLLKVTDGIKYMRSRIFIIKQQRKISSITLHMLLMKGGDFGEFLCKTCLSDFIISLFLSFLNVFISRFDAFCEKLQRQQS